MSLKLILIVLQVKAERTVDHMSMYLSYLFSYLLFALIFPLLIGTIESGDTKAKMA